MAGIGRNFFPGVSDFYGRCSNPPILQIMVDKCIWLALGEAFLPGATDSYG